MTDNDIRARVNTIVNAYAKGVKFKPEDVVVVNATIDLVVNFLECINIIANKKN